jgi:hypothetical protein
MHRLAIAVVFLALSAFPQSPASDPQAISFAQRSIAALTSGNAVSDVTLNANIISSTGTDSNSGTGTLYTKGISESRVDVTVNNVTRSDIRNMTSGNPTGGWNQNGGPFSAYAQHNCWTDSAWFFPALSALSQTANPNFIFRYVAQEQYNGAQAQHIQVFRYDSKNSYLAQLSTMDFYLDIASLSPLGVKFNIHADDNMIINIPSEVRFAVYQQVTGIQIPFHVQRLLNGDLVLDVTVVSAVVNSGLSDAVFSLQ